MPVTNRGRKWEVINSLWTLWSFVFICNYVGFFIIGFKTKNRKWSIIGGCLLITSVLVLDYFTHLLKVGNMLITPISLISYIIGIRLSFKYRIEYLIRKDFMLSKVNNVSEKEIQRKIKEIEYDEHRGEIRKNNRKLIVRNYLFDNVSKYSLDTIYDKKRGRIAST